MYQKPEPKIDRILKADSFSIPLLNHQKTALIKRYAEEMPSISYVARPQLKLGGERFNPKNYTSISNAYLKRLAYFDLKTRKEKTIEFPKNSVIRETLWSPDGKFLAVSIEKELDHELWIVQIPSLKKTKIAGVSLSAVLGRTIEWLGSQQLLIGVRTAKQTRPLNLEKEVPTSPVIQESGGRVSQNRTFPDLIKTAQDERLFAQAIESQLVIYDVKKKKKTKVGKPGFYSRVRPSPDGTLILIERYLQPFSKVVPSALFARKTEIWDRRGKVVYSFDAAGPFESLPIQGVPTGPRSIQWIDSDAHALVYAEALDQGDWSVQVDHRDELFKLDLSKKKPKAESLIRLKNRYAGFYSFAERDSYWIYDYERDREWITTIWLKRENEWNQKTLFSLSQNDDYADPGNPVFIRNEMSRLVIAQDEGRIFMSGKGSSPEGDRPFLRRFDLTTLESEDWFRCEKGTYERFMAFIDDSYSSFLTAYESQKESPRYFLRHPRSETRKLVYADKNPYEILTRIKKEVVTYERADGVKLSGILYYPLDYQPGQKYPAIIQAYPLEYTDASTAGQVRGSSDQFSRPYHEDIVYNALRGYFVLDDAQMPIIGHPETKNDTFIEQLVSGAKAAVDVLDARGLIDRKRVGIIGHSYGGFMVANLLSHSDLFATGIAKSGAYNRTLTPFGFQGERRPLWKAKETYLKMSPFMYADQIKKPIMLMHGMADNNTGTFPIQSERYFEALKGQGAQARMVLLPEESHGYASIESIQHVLYEIFNWFDRYLGA